MAVDRYFAEIANELKRKSDRVKEGFSTHALSAGQNREDLVGNFLREYLPKSFGIDTGLILSCEGEFSKQADLVIVDQLHNAPLFPSSTNKLWLVESVYALIEVKTDLTPSNLQDSLEKCVKFKRLKRNFQEVPQLPRISESLFVLWAFNGPSNQTIKENITNAIKEMNIDEQPDFIIIPDQLLVTAGSYRRIVKFGMQGSQYQNEILQKYPGKTYTDLFEPYEFLFLNENSLFTWLIWITSWLKGAGIRSALLEAYVDISKVYGEKL